MNSDTALFEGCTLELEDRGDGVFSARYTMSYPGSADLAGVLTVSAEGDACIAKTG